MATRFQKQRDKDQPREKLKKSSMFFI